jgi:hypothetical protein
MLQFLVLCCGVLSDRMDNSAAVLLNVDDGSSPLQIGGYVCVLNRPPEEEQHWPLPPIKAGWHSSSSP